MHLNVVAASMPLVDYVIAIWLGKSLITPFVCFVMTFIDRAFVIHSFGLLALTAAAFKAKSPALCKIAALLQIAVLCKIATLRVEGAALDRCCLHIAATPEPCG